VNHTKRKPGEVRDAILDYLKNCPSDASVEDIQQAVASRFKEALAASSVRSYLRLNTPTAFERTAPGRYRLKLYNTAAPIRPTSPRVSPTFQYGHATLHQADCFDWLAQCPPASIQAVVTDPPYGLVEYSPEQQSKLRARKGGVWRIPPSFDGHQRSPLPRFTTLGTDDLRQLVDFFFAFAKRLLPALVPGAHVLIASNPLLSYLVSGALANAGLERRGEIVRLVMTMRGGDRPKNAHDQFPEVSVMSRSMWEPWLVFRKPLEGRVQDNLRKWKTGGLRRPSKDKPFGDVIASHPTNKSERALAPHPSLKPQLFLRQIVRAVLPLGQGTILDPFAGSGSTLAAAEALGYPSIGIEKDSHYFDIAKSAIPKLAAYKLTRHLQEVDPVFPQFRDPVAI